MSKLMNKPKKKAAPVGGGVLRSKRPVSEMPRYSRGQDGGWVS